MRLKVKGFTFIEVLVSLIIVSLTAVSISGLQIKVAEQQGHNIAHASAISMATAKIEKMISIIDPDDLIALHETSETNVQIANTTFSILWNINDVIGGHNAGDDFKQVKMNISWVNNQGNLQHFVHLQQIDLGTLLSNASELFPTIITTDLSSDEIIYFDPKVEYQEGAFVIYDSYLYQATSDYLIGNEPPEAVVDSSTGLFISHAGWQSYGQIDGTNLINNNGLASLF
ncbi:prepilin-type N-terminal cleavage/methylation domain-containing protein [Psychromonas sp. SP041]|uniref:type IV pilus modification PilV family protein n=1 Tax=Psychromonas sp. SP041 TaxID=1365007 RepID=UPI00040E7F22|nr:prepilin-type N-terminal cleavage/methylation domain-containing protein [Psychromonas sp. SP041]